MEQLAALAARHALPAIYPYREYALLGDCAHISISFNAIIDEFQCNKCLSSG
jgi:hypothetical protein